MYSYLRNHFRDASENIRLIEREKLLLDRKKILPDLITDQLSAWPDGISSMFHFQMNRNLPRTAAYLMHKVVHGEADMYGAMHENLNADYQALAREFFEFYMERMRENYKGRRLPDGLENGAAEIRAGMDDGSFIYICRPVGDWLEAHEVTRKDPGLTWWGKMSSYLGEGEKVLHFWRTLNEMPDWKDFAERMEIIGGPPRGRKKDPLPKDRKDLAWKPAVVGSPA